MTATMTHTVTSEGLPIPYCTPPKKPTKYKFSPEQDDLIRKVYREKQQIGRNSVVSDLARRLGIPRWKVSRRARVLGVVEPRIKEPAWSEQELHILELNALFCPEVIQRKLKMAGFVRSATGINLKRKRMRFRQQQIPCSARRWLSASE